MKNSVGMGSVAMSSIGMGSIAMVNVPEWAKLVHARLYDIVERRVQNVDGMIDWSMSVRKLLSVLEIARVFKDGNDKIAFLEKV